MTRIFISYRREDSGDAAGRLCDLLRSHFGPKNVFFDVDSISCGDEFPLRLAEEIGRCNVLLAVIGERWLDLPHGERPTQSHRRLDDPKDFVRIEIQSALARGIRVVPVLVGKATMPLKEDLPDDLKDLAQRNAAEVRSGRDFRAHVDRLARSLDSRRRVRLWARVCGLVLLLGMAGLLLCRDRPEAMPLSIHEPDEGANQADLNHTPPRYRGKVHVLIERIDTEGSMASQGVGTSTAGLLGSPVGQGPLLASALLYPGRIVVRSLKLNQVGALPLRKSDSFRIECEVDPPAYLYVVWVDPGHDITPVYPWDPTLEGVKEQWDSRPAKEEPTGRVRLPQNSGERYIAPDARDGITTIVLFARPTPLDVPDDVLRKEFDALPDLPLPEGGNQAVVWFDNYAEVHEPDRFCTFGVVGSSDPFTRWQGQLRQIFGGKAAFQTAISFARMSGK